LLIATVRSGYTLPVFAVASAIAALRCLQGSLPTSGSEDLKVEIDLINPAQRVEIEIEQVSLLHDNLALGITRSDPGDNLDLTRHTPIWAAVAWADPSQVESIVLVGGEGVGKQVNLDNQPAFYSYAKTLFQANLAPLLAPEQKIRVTIVLPEGRQLATRTSNAAFGVVEGLSLLGTSGISQPLSAPGQLEACLTDLRVKVQKLRDREMTGVYPVPALVFCIGENGLDLVRRRGISPDRTVKTANWIGPLLVEAGLQGVKDILLFGYHGKLMKLAGGIFHTHHHLADGRSEIFIAAAVRKGLPRVHLEGLFDCETAEAGLTYLREIDRESGSNWVEQIYGYIVERINTRSQEYIYNQSQQQVRVTSTLFDRDREIIISTTTTVPPHHPGDSNPNVF
jgi:cobalt-precorrin-5B (C1)-methyltransferase